MRRYEDVVENQQGTPVAGVSVQVNVAGSSTPASLFSDDGITPLLNPVKTDSLGRFSFWIATGKYDLIANGGGISVIYTQQNVSIDELTDPNPLDLPWATEQLMFVPQTVSPDTPPEGSVVYSKQVDNNLYYKNAAGQEIGPLGQSGVISVNGGTGAVIVQAGTNVTVTTVGNVITINATGGGGGGGGVTSLNGLIGAISLIQGSNVSIAQVGNNLQISASASTSNLYVDVTSFGAKPVLPFAPPNAQASCTAGSTTITLNTPSQFTNGEGVAFYDCGPACTLATPGAPTVTPSYASSLTGVGDVVNAPAGTTSYSYQVMARAQNGSFTAAGPVGTTAVGNTLGKIEVAVSTLTRSGNVVTVQMATAQQMVVGQTVYIKNSSDASFSGFYLVSSVSNAFTFSYLQGLTTANGASTSATGGVVDVYSCNFVSWAPVSGAFQYYIYGAQGAAALSIIGVTPPGVTSFEDYGPTFTQGAPTRPLYIPASPPVASAPGILSTTIVSGGGTTTLVVANAASSSTTNVYCQHDDAPAILAAAQFCISSNGRNTLHFPVAAGPGGNHVNSAYLVSSYLVLPFALAGVVQSMPIWLADTMQLPGNLTWVGDIGGSLSVAPTFAWNTAIPIMGNGANPCIWQDPNGQGANRWQNISLQTNTNGTILVLGNSGALFNISFEFCSFVINGNSDFMGMCILAFGTSQVYMKNTLLSASNAGVSGYSLTPLFFQRPDIPAVNGAGTVVADRLFLLGRGVFAKSPNLGGRFQYILTNCYTQSLKAPYLTLGTMNEASVVLEGIINDTGITSLFCNLNPNALIAPDVIITGANQVSAEPGGFVGFMSGAPARSVFSSGLDAGLGGNDMQIGQNFNTVVARGGGFQVQGPATLGSLALSAVSFASLGASSNGTFLYCPDCTVTSPCAGAGTGALAKRLNSTWVCN